MRGRCVQRSLHDLQPWLPPCHRPAAPKFQLPSSPFGPRKQRQTVQKLVLYRGRGMLLWRFVVRAKVFQLMGFLAASVFASVVLTQVPGGGPLQPDSP
jgi:hypothetical protein